MMEINNFKGLFHVDVHLPQKDPGTLLKAQLSQA